MLKAIREKIMHKETPIRLSTDFSVGKKGVWHSTFKLMKGKNLQSRILYPVRLSFRFDREIKNFMDKQKLRELSTTRPALQQMLKELL